MPTECPRVSTQASPLPEYRYRAFISYSHRDSTWAAWLHKALEGYVIPPHLVGTVTDAGVVPPRLAPVFRDRDELASAGDLGRTVNAALAQSESLIVICSPHAATSRWVNEEVLSFKRLGRTDRIFCVLVGGEPHASRFPGREDDECFVPALRYRLGPDGELSHDIIEPIAADARHGGDSKLDAKLKLVAGLLGVGFDALKQRELHRRTRRAVRVSVIALGVMALTTVLAISAFISRHAAVVASQVAARHQKEAEDLVSFMLGDLNDKLSQVARLDIMEAVDDHAMNYFQKQPTDEVTDSALAQRVVALEKIGNVRLDQGRLGDAMASYQAALAIAARLAVKAPADIPLQLAHAEVWAYIGMTQWRLARLDDAQRSFTSSQTILERAGALAPGNTQLAFQLAMIDNNMGHVMEARGELDQATGQYQRMLSLMEDLVAGQPHNPSWGEYLGSAYNNLGKMALMRGDLADAVARYSADERIQMGLVDADPKDMSRRDNLLTVHAILGRTQALMGDTGPGMERLQRAVDMATQLTVLDPSNTDYQEHAALYGIQLARLRRLNGDLPAAMDLTAKAMATFVTLTRHDAGNAAWQRECAEALVEQSEQSRATGNPDAARQQAMAALHALTPLMKQQPDDRATLLAGTQAALAVADVTADARVASELRTGALANLRKVRSGQRDPRLRALYVDALLAQERRADAMPVIHQLLASGYRDMAMLQTLRAEHIDIPASRRITLVAAGRQE